MILLLIGLCAFLAVALLVMAANREISAQPSGIQGRIEAISRAGAAPAYDAAAAHALRPQRYSQWQWLQRLLQRTPRAALIAAELDRAGMRIRVGPYLVLSAGIGLLFAYLILRLPAIPFQFVLAIGAFVVGVYLPRWYMKRRIRSRRAQFEAVLPDALDMIGRSLRGGSGLLIAIENMLEQVSGPLAIEFTRFQDQVGAGLSIEDAFRSMDERVASKDLHIAITAMLIQREVGGNLSEILNNVTEIMRERVRLRGEVKALVSRQVFSAYILVLVPPAIGLAMFLLLPDVFLKSLLHNPIGWLILAVGAVWDLLGFLVVRRIGSSPVEV